MPERRVVLVVLACWFLLVLAGSLLGLFAREILHAPIPLGLAAITPVVVFLGWYVGSQGLQQFVLSLDMRKLTLAHTWRLTGVIFVLLYFRGVLPGVFALPAGLGDMAIGLTAPVIASLLKSRARFPTRLFVLWNILGILDMVLAVTLGVLASLPLGLVSEKVTTRAMGFFPLNLIPTFLVPFFLILHLIALIRVRRGAY